ncbi:MAG: type II toxin-antitoxin system RatA family toxin [Alphaproteobacteria bacterium]
MPTHAETRVVPYTPEQMFTLVADIESYPEFLPWCVSARINSREDNEIKADLAIGYKMFREHFVSTVRLSPFEEIRVKYEQGPFKYLNNHWKFKEVGDGSCEIDFFVDFAFKSSVLQTAMTFFFNEAVQLMIGAFEQRAKTLYQKTSC